AFSSSTRRGFDGFTPSVSFSSQARFLAGRREGRGRGRCHVHQSPARTLPSSERGVLSSRGHYGRGSPSPGREGQGAGPTQGSRGGALFPIGRPWRQRV